MRQNTFRYDINGLRAYALLMVVFYHFKLPFFGAGFIGVDIFFVISGYFMTKIIADGIQKNNFSLISFFYARFMRIVPPLLLVTVTVYIIGFLVLNPEDLKYYCQYVIKALTFTSNLTLLKEADDYFAADSAKNLLLHTWSLSVEWQFYLLYPFLFLAINLFSKKNNNTLALLALLLLLSLSFSIFESQINRAYDFYMLATRAWEMLAGGIVYLLEKNDTSAKFPLSCRLKMLGIFAILVALSLFSEQDHWPGYLAVLVIIGAALVIYKENNQLKILNNKLIYKIGLASYSIYLWHWPFHFFFNYYFPHPHLLISFIASILSILLGYGSYFIIEKRMIDGLKAKGKIFSFSIIIGIALLFVGVNDYTRKHSGFSWRGGEHYLSLVNQIKMPSPEDGWCFYAIASHREFSVGNQGVQCQIGDTQHPVKKALLFGDSYAGHYIPFWQGIGEKMQMEIQAVTTNWCNPSTGDDFPGPRSSRAYQQCLFNRHYVMEHIKDYDVIILAGSWTKNFVNQRSIAGLSDLVEKIHQQHVPIIIMDEPYQFADNVGQLYKQHLWRHQYFNIRPYSTQEMDATLQTTSAILDKVSTPSPTTLHLRRSDLFSPTHYAQDDVPYSLDGGHISVLGSLAAERYFIEQGGLNKLSTFLGP